MVCCKRDAVVTSEVCNKATVINFSSTFESLQDQLLSQVIKLVIMAIMIVYVKV